MTGAAADAVLAVKVLAVEIQAQSLCISQFAVIAAKVVKSLFSRPARNRFFAIIVSGINGAAAGMTGIIPAHRNWMKSTPSSTGFWQP